jgi:hypothetical protein
VRVCFVAHSHHFFTNDNFNFKSVLEFAFI